MTHLLVKKKHLSSKHIFKYINELEIVQHIGTTKQDVDKTITLFKKLSSYNLLLIS